MGVEPFATRLRIAKAPDTCRAAIDVRLTHRTAWWRVRCRENRLPAAPAHPADAFAGGCWPNFSEDENFVGQDTSPLAADASDRSRPIVEPRRLVIAQEPPH